MTPERGDLLLIPFPFSDHSASKRRPVLALTPPDAFGDFTALPVTSRPQGPHGLDLTPADLTSGSLPLRSWIRTDRPVTLNSALSVKVLAKVSDALAATAVRRLCARLGH